MVLLRPFLRFNSPSFLFKYPHAGTGEEAAAGSRRRLLRPEQTLRQNLNEEELLACGDQIHSHLFKSGHLHPVSTFNFLLKLYSKNLHLKSALNLFDEMPQRNIVSWNTVISGFAIGEHFCFFFLKEMMLEKTRPDHITFLGVLRSCYSSSPIHGEQAHCLVFKLGLSSHMSISTAMVNMYAKLRLPTTARHVFDEMTLPDQVSWNAMISCYSLNSLYKEAFEIFNLMRLKGSIRGDPYTFSSLLTGCSYSGCFDLGGQVHALVFKSCPSSDLVLFSSIVNFYSKCGSMEAIRRCFFSSESFFLTRSAVPWNSIIVGCCEPVKLLQQMLWRGVDPDDVTFSSILSSCSRSALAKEVLQLHTHIIKRGLQSSISISNAMIIAYAKCGAMHEAFEVFSMISSPDLISWTSIISACAIHGLGLEALQMLERIIQTGMKPDQITILHVLSACVHCGLVEEGLCCFVSMVKEHQIEPSSEHYTCLVDLLGRAGLLHDAGRLLSSLLELSGADAGSHLRAFLSACKIHGNSRLAELAAGLLLRSRLDKPVDFLDMGSVYAGGGSWVRAEKARKMMSVCGKKSSGWSWAG